MCNGKTIVVTVYGQVKLDESFDKIAISLFGDTPNHFRTENNAKTYCETVGALRYNGESRIFAKIVEQNTPFRLGDLRPFSEIMLSLDDRTVQRLLSRVDRNDIAVITKLCGKKLAEKINGNISEEKLRAVKERQEEEYFHTWYSEDVQEKILSIYRKMRADGEFDDAVAENEKTEETE